MKTSLLLAVLLLTGISYAQIPLAAPLGTVDVTSLPAYNIHPLNAPSFSLPSTLRQKGGNAVQGSLDTVDDHFRRSTRFLTYGITINNVTFPLVGTNPVYRYVGEGFSNTSSVTVEGVLVAISQKSIVVENDSFEVAVFNANATGDATTLLRAQKFLLDDVVAHPDTLNVEFVYFPLATAAVCTSNFVVYMQTVTGRRNGNNQNSGIAIFSNEQGEGQGEKRGRFLAWDAQNSRWVNGGFHQLQFGGDPIDIDVMILPVIAGSTTGAESPVIGGFRLDSFSTNAAGDEAQLSFAMEQPSPLSISIVDMQGRTLTTVQYNAVSEQNNLRLNLGNLPSGSYFYTIRTASTSFAGKFVLSK